MWLCRNCHHLRHSHDIITLIELKARRLALGLSQEALARKLSVSTSTLVRWETGRLGLRHPLAIAALLEKIEHEKELA